MLQPEKKWRQFERLVAAIHQMTEKGGIVTWDDEIDGRQFDVTIRFKHHAYQYLTVIECRDVATSIPVGDVEAFVTKAHGARANKAVMVAANGFQSGAKTVAEKHNLELFTLKEEEGLPLWVIVDGRTSFWKNAGKPSRMALRIKCERGASISSQEPRSKSASKILHL